MLHTGPLNGQKRAFSSCCECILDYFWLTVPSYIWLVFWVACLCGVRRPKIIGPKETQCQFLFPEATIRSLIRARALILLFCLKMTS